jgi:hypothetical protein
VALALIRFLLIPSLANQKTPSLAQDVGDLADNLLTALLASVAVFGLLATLWGPERREVRFIAPTKIRETLQDGLSTTSHWTYKGHIGRSFVANILPQLIEKAQTDNEGHLVKLMVLDPASDAALKAHTRLRRQHGPQAKEHLQVQLWSTILGSIKQTLDVPVVTIEIYLHNAVSFVRNDLWDAGGIMTNENAQEKAVYFPDQSLLYKLVAQDMRVIQEQRACLDLSSVHTMDTPAEIEGAIRTLKLHLPEQGNLTSLVSQVHDLIAQPIDPFAPKRIP